jgi:hypothetical protein
MTVKELLEELKAMDENLPVRIVYPSGDHWRTVLAKEAEAVGLGKAEMSEYHGEYKGVDPSKEDDEDTHQEPAVMLG